MVKLEIFAVAVFIIFASTQGVLHAQFVGNSTIHAVAVITPGNQGVVTEFRLIVTKGNGTVNMVGPAHFGNSTKESIYTAINYATQALGINERNYNFTYDINDNGSNVSGPSGGLAFTLLTISALSNKQLPSNFAATGTISDSGKVGQVGGVYDKADAAKLAGLSYIIVPYAAPGTFEETLYYIINKSIGISVAETSNVSQATGYIYGGNRPTAPQYGVQKDYYTGGLTNATQQCSICQEGYFSNLTNFTFNITNSEINNINNQYYGAKEFLSSQMSQYSIIAAKGYLYAAADLSYLEFVNAFVLSHSLNVTKDSTYALTSNTTEYCMGVKPVQMTNTNYEYVVGGEMRLLWANITLSEAQASINSSNTTDELIGTLSNIGAAYGWCSASAYMFSIASKMGGIPVMVPSSIQGAKSELTSTLHEYNGTLYAIAAEQAYKNGEYAVSLYNIAYANALYSTFPNASTAANNTYKLINASANGIWPDQFSKEAEFYMQESKTANITPIRIGYITEAYSTALLASKLSNVNMQISQSFIPINESTNLQQSGYTNLSNQISQIYAYLLVISILVIVLLVLVLSLLIKNGNTKRDKHAKRSVLR